MKKRKLPFQMTTCTSCGEKYTFTALVSILSEHSNVRIGDSFEDREVEEQLGMKLCGNCRVEKLRSSIGKNEEMCANCLWYGFSHPSNLDGRCLNCGDSPSYRGSQT